MKKALIILLIIVLITSCEKESVVENIVTLPDEKVIELDISNDVNEIFNKVNIDSLSATLKILTGETPFINNSDTTTILSRNVNSPGNEIAANYLESRLLAYGHEVTNQKFNLNGRNVLGEKKGTINPDKYYIICAHYDSAPEGNIAPGADDNASGTALVIEAARLFSNIQSEFSIIFALWDEEEIGLLGSKFYAENAKNSGLDIKGVINVDMIGWDSNGDNFSTIAVKSSNNISILALTAKVINSKLKIGMDIDYGYGISRSDHKSFWTKGYDAIMFIEELSDLNTFYHTGNDKINFINMKYYENHCKLIITTLAYFVL